MWGGELSCIKAASLLGLAGRRCCDVFFQSMSERFFSIQEVLELAFSILYDPDETLNFIAPNKYEVRNIEDEL